MVKAVLFSLLAVFLCPLNALCADTGGNAASPVNKIRLVFGSHELVVVMFDNPASRDFMSLLPLDAAFKDFGGEEKIAYLPRKLNTADASSASEAQGDFTYYKPWGNLAVFYKGFGSNGQLTVLGRIESGKSALADMVGPFSARIEKIE